MKSLTYLGVVFIDNLGIAEPDSRSLHNHSSDPESDCGRLLGSMPATQLYKGRLCGIKTEEIAVLCGGDLYNTIILALGILYSTVDYSTTAGWILILFKGDCWAWRQISNGIRYVSVASKLRNLLSSVERIFIIALVIHYSTADSSTTVRRIVILFAGGCWAWRQLPNGIGYVSVAPRPRNSLSSVEKIFIVLVALTIFYLRADYSTTNRPILILFAGGCWARCLLPNGRRYVLVASKPMNPPTLLRLVFLKVYELDGRFHNSRWADSGSDCGRLFALTPALQWDKVLTPATFIHDTVLNGIMAIPELDGWFGHNQWSDCGSDCGRLLGLTPATQR